MRTFATLTVTGVLGIVLFKVLTALLFPVLAMFVGLISLTIKVALIAAVVWFVYSLMNRRKEAAAA